MCRPRPVSFGPKVGETARLGAQQVFEDVKNSRLNPLVKTQMQEEIARNQLGIAAIHHALNNPKWAYATTGVGTGGPTMVAPITQPVTQQAAQDVDWNKDGGGGGGGGGGGSQPTITRTGATTGVDQKSGQQYHEATPGSNQWIPGSVDCQQLTIASERGLKRLGLLLPPPPTEKDWQQPTDNATDMTKI
jgi:hypothetical protein